jgi:hypothetical protein
MKKLNYLLITALLLCFSNAGNANLISNSTFDSDLSGWDTDATTGVTWTAGEARVGQSGTPGYAIFSQIFDIVDGTDNLLVGFDYAWQVNPPISVDTFTVDLGYLTAGGMVFNTLFSQGSDDATFGTVFSPSYLTSLVGLVAAPGNGILRFTLTETNPSNGTRVHVDNVNVEAVPEPSILALLGLGLMGLGLRRYKQ